MLLAYNMKFNPKRMKKLEKEYTVMKTKEQEEMVELRVCSYEEDWWCVCVNWFLHRTVYAIDGTIICLKKFMNCGVSYETNWAISFIFPPVIVITFV